MLCNPWKNGSTRHEMVTYYYPNSCFKKPVCPTTTTTTTTQAPLQRCSFAGEVSGLFLEQFIEDNDPPNPIVLYTGTWSYQIIDFTINGTQYGTGQILTFTTPGDAILGYYLDGITPYVTNMEDWINSICAGTGLEFFNDKQVWQYPVGMTFTLVIRRLYQTQYDYWYTNNGFTFTGAGGTPIGFIPPTCILI